jgi:sialate O-acetylesterase
MLSAAQSGVIFNSMIHPFIACDIQGVIWYQGESNAREKLLPYDVLLPMLIKDWRHRWGYEFPFYYAQLAGFGPPTTEPGIADPWPLLQDRMRKVLKTAPKTGMAVLNDVGEENNIHPSDKRTPGERLALWALGKTYGKDVVYSGPLYETFAIDDGVIKVRFSSVGQGLESRDGKPLQRFEIAGVDRKWYWAKAEIVGTREVKLSHPNVAEPVAARYAWAKNPAGANLVNGSGLPSSVFRTDDWDDVFSSKH